MTHNWETLVKQKNKEIDRLNQAYQTIFPKDKDTGREKVDIFEGTGIVKDKNSIEITFTHPENQEENPKVITGEYVLVAVGGWPFKPTIPGIEHAITSNEVFYLEKRPERVVVVGGGYIAVEFANIFNGYGSQVHLLYRGNLFLRGFDNEVRAHLAEQMEHQEKMDVRFNCNPAEIKKQGDGSFTVVLENGESIDCDAVFYATGRKSKAKTEILNLDQVGVKMDKDGNVLVDKDSKTNVDNIYAVGDVTNRINLTPVALHEGHVFADTVFGKLDRTADHEFVCSAVFSNPEIGTVGITEEEIFQNEEYKQRNYSVFTSKFTPMKYNMILGPKYRKDLMKIIVDDTNGGRVVGVHICGGSAAEMLQGVGIAVKMGATKADFDRTIGIHPTSAEELVTMRQPKRRYEQGKLVSGEPLPKF